MTDQPFEFKDGDRVSWCGVEGVVLRVENTGWPLIVSFGPDRTHSFTKEGKWYPWHKEPSLKLIERPKRKVTKMAEVWMNVFPDSDVVDYWSSKKMADFKAANRIACVKLTGSYEVEE